jgi:o-succinylbenzoate synthase
VRVQLEPVDVRLRAPFASASGSIRNRELLLLRLTGADGVVGIGEAAPLRPYDGVGIGDVRAALEDCGAALAASDGTDRAALLSECADRSMLPQALAAVDLALWDLAGRRAGQPVWQLLAGVPDSSVEVNATIASADRAGAAAEAAAARAAGFRCLKLKVGIGDDAGRLAAVRAAVGRELTIRIDANGAWSHEEALTTLRALEPTGIELCEEPVSGLAAIARLSAQAPVPIAIDETAVDPQAFDRQACAAICLKIARCGGISGAIDAAQRARKTGYDVYLASTLDGPIGIAAALHVAATIRPRRASGLATLSLFEGRGDPLPARRGRLAVPSAPGLGERLIDWYS